MDYLRSRIQLGNFETGMYIVVGHQKREKENVPWMPFKTN